MPRIRGIVFTARQSLRRRLGRMHSTDPFSLGALGAALAVGGLVTLMLAETPTPHALITAAACLVGALLAFALEALLRPWRPAVPNKGARAAAGRPRAPDDAPGRAPAASPEPPAPTPATGQPHRAVLGSVRVRRAGRHG